MALPRTPGPDEVVLHVHSGGDQLGPMSRRDLATKVDQGDIDHKVHVWFEGMDGWAVLAEHRDLLEGLGEPGGASPRAPGESEDDYYDRLFGEQVKKSWDYLYDHSFAGHIDEVLVGAVITSTLDAGGSLIDLTSDGSNHYLRFEDMSDGSRLIFRLNHLTSALQTARVLGQRASVIIGYGEKVSNIAKVMNAVRAEMQSGYIRNAEPGTITVDGDLKSGYVYVQVDLFWTLSDYIKPDYSIDHARLTTHIHACKHALRKYLRGRFA